MSIFEHDARGQLLTRITAAEGRVDSQAMWNLRDVRLTRWPSQPPMAEPVGVPPGQAGAATKSAAQASAAAAPTPHLSDERLPELAWRSSLRADVVAAAVLPLKTMTTLDLWRYSSHLARQAQDSQRHAIQFWKKALYPLACMVMVALALPFAYLHARAGGLSLKVFGGIMLGISFVLLNNVAGHLGVLRDWTPWVAAATPALTYLLISLVAFAWLVRYR